MHLERKNANMENNVCKEAQLFPIFYYDLKRQNKKKTRQKQIGTFDIPSNIIKLKQKKKELMYCVTHKKVENEEPSSPI